jgi:hypothetical protein
MPVLLWLIYPYVLWPASVDTLYAAANESFKSDQKLQELT